MDRVLDIVQLALLAFAVLTGVIGLVLYSVDRRRIKHKTVGCINCGWWITVGTEKGVCGVDGCSVRAGQRACHVERRGK